MFDEESSIFIATLFFLPVFTFYSLLVKVKIDLVFCTMLIKVLIIPSFLFLRLSFQLTVKINKQTKNQNQLTKQATTTIAIE